MNHHSHKVLEISRANRQRNVRSWGSPSGGRSMNCGCCIFFAVQISSSKVTGCFPPNEPSMTCWIAAVSAADLRQWTRSQYQILVKIDHNVSETSTGGLTSVISPVCGGINDWRFIDDGLRLSRCGWRSSCSWRRSSGDLFLRNETFPVEFDLRQ